MRGKKSIILGFLKYAVVILAAGVIAVAVSDRIVDHAGIQYSAVAWDDLSYKLSNLRQDVDALEADDTAEKLTELVQSPLYGKTIIYEGDSIAESRSNNGGGYPALIAELTGSTYENFARSGAHLTSSDDVHSVVDNLENLPDDADLYCFEGGINDFWGSIPIGECDPSDYTGPLDTGTICGALETIFRYCLDNLPGKPVCFVITHKIQHTAHSPNPSGVTFADYHNAMVAVCEKYSIPYYDAFLDSGLNGWNQTQSDLYLTACEADRGDGTHPNAEGYKRYYVPQLLDLFERILPVE